MTWEENAVKLLAPAGNWDALEAAVEAGADAVYLGGKAFNMRLHRQEMNFDNEALARAVSYAHAHEVRLYITINNLISEEELPPLREYLLYLDEIRPDAILVQDFAVISLAEELGISLPLHASVMMNIHNEAAMRLLKEHGVPAHQNILGTHRRIGTIPKEPEGTKTRRRRKRHRQSPPPRRCGKILQGNRRFEMTHDETITCRKKEAPSGVTKKKAPEGGFFLCPTSSRTAANSECRCVRPPPSPPWRALRRDRK